jgi:glucose-6-phosphate dehydrogenase assembly protein OpcA
MTTTYKVLGQSAPNATTNVDLYTVPASTQSIVSTLVIANRGSASSTYRIAIRPAGQSLANTHYVTYDTLVGGGDSTALTLGITLAATDVITVYASSADLTFSAFGSSIVA